MSRECGGVGIKEAAWAANAPDRSQAELLARNIIEEPKTVTTQARPTEPFVRRWDLMSADAISDHLATRAAARVENYVQVREDVSVPLSRRTW